MNSRSRQVLRVVAYNALVLFTLVNLAYWSIPVVDLFLSWRSGGNPGEGSQYRSFIGWRSPAVVRADITVRGTPYTQRRTVNDGTAQGANAYFFGGSTMFGLGAADAGTIPSRFASATKIHSENFGEIGYTAHQSLVLLIALLQAGHRPGLVVFYDGVNDVMVKCLSALTPTSHGREADIRDLMQGHDRPASFASYLRPVVRLAERLRTQSSKAAGVSPYDCDTDASKAEAVAGNLLADWRIAKLLVESFGGTFVGVLQPVSYFTTPPPKNLQTPAFLDRQYQAVYPLVREQIGRRGEFHDLVSVLDGNAQAFTDFNHVTVQGNEAVAHAIAGIVASVKSVR